MDHFLSGGNLIHLINVFWSLCCKLIQVGLPDDDKQHQVARHQTRSGFNHFRSHRRFRQIGDPNHQTAPLLIVEQPAGGLQVVALPLVFLHQSKLPHHLHQVCTAASGRNPLPDPASIGQQPDPVSGIQSDLSQGQGSVNCIVQLAEARDPCTHEPAGIEQDPDGLTPFNFVETSDQLSATRAGRPADVAELIPLAVFTETFEGSTGAADARVTLFQFYLTAADEINRMAFGLFQVWIGSDSLRYRNLRPTFSDSHRTLVTNVNISKISLPASHRQDRVLCFSITMRTGSNLQLRRLKT